MVLRLVTLFATLKEFPVVRCVALARLCLARVWGGSCGRSGLRLCSGWLARATGWVRLSPPIQADGRFTRCRYRAPKQPEPGDPPGQALRVALPQVRRTR